MNYINTRSRERRVGLSIKSGSGLSGTRANVPARLLLRADTRFSDVITRFSHEGRVKLILMCAVQIIAVIMLFSLTAFAEGESESSGVYLPPARTNIIRTSNTSDNYSVFETQNSTITMRGKYTGDAIRRVIIDSVKNEITGTYSLKAEEDGSYEAQITTTPDDGEHRLIIVLNSGAALSYVIFYDSVNGWYFPVSGYAESNPRVFDHIFEAPAEAAALYLSPTKDADEIMTALEQINMLSGQVTSGIEDDYEKARAISRFVSEKLYYDYEARDDNVDNETIALCNVLKTSKTVCAGFTNLFCAMAEAAGIDAVNIRGGITNDEISYESFMSGSQNHEWAAFYYEKEKRWVWVDSCWDGSGSYKEGKWYDSKPKYMYFDISEEALSLNHHADKAERRRYFAARTETGLLGAQGAGDGGEQSVITSQQTAAAETPAEEAETETQDNGQIQPVVSDGTDTVLIIIIAVLAAAVVVVAAIIIRLLLKGRKQ